jgi:hypothetical protein
MKRNMACLLVIVLLAGCAGSFRPSEKTLHMKQGMDRHVALDVFIKYTKAQPGNSGYCGGNKFSFDPGTPLNITEAGYTLRAYKRGELISTEKVGDVTRYTYKKVYYEDGRKFANLGKIRISHVGNSFSNCTKPARDEVTLSLHYGLSDIDGILIAPGNLDEMVAALMVLAPQAKWIEGAGI